MNAVLVVSIFGNMILVLIGFSCWKFNVPQNRYVGFRTTKTLNDEQIWHKTNKRLGLRLLIISLVMLIIFVAVYVGYAAMGPMLILSLVFFQQFLLLGLFIETYIWLSKQ